MSADCRRHEASRDQTIDCRACGAFVLPEVAADLAQVSHSPDQRRVGFILAVSQGAEDVRLRPAARLFGRRVVVPMHDHAGRDGLESLRVGAHLDGLDVEREHIAGREIALFADGRGARVRRARNLNLGIDGRSQAGVSASTLR